MAARLPIVITVLNSQYLAHNEDGIYTLVRDFANDILDADPDAGVIVTGDLNDFQFGEPGEEPDHPVAILV